MNTRATHGLADGARVRGLARSAGTWAGISLGVPPLMLAGVLPTLLSALAFEHRLGGARLGQTATLEAVSMGLAAGLCAMLMTGRRLRMIGLAAALALAALDFLTPMASGAVVMILRAAAGAPEGVLLWIAFGTIARAETPARWAGAFFAAATACQIALAAVLAVLVLPHLHAEGGFALAGLLTLALAPAARLGADQFAPWVARTDHPDAGPRGWAALGGALLFVAAASAVGPFMVPLARQAGLGATGAGMSVAATLVGQAVGAGLAIAVAPRAHHFGVLLIGILAILACWAILMFWPPAWLFVAAASAAGFATMLAAAFLPPMAIEADPSGKAAVRLAAAVPLGGALGRLLAERLARQEAAHGVLVLGAVLLIAALSTFGGLHLTAGEGRDAIS